MGIVTRNRLNIASRWRKVQEEEKRYIQENEEKYHILKARILGFLAGDGNIYNGNGTTNRHHYVRFYPDHESLVNAFCDAFFKTYNKKPIIKKLKNVYCLTVDSKTVVGDICKSALFGLKRWRVPFKSIPDKDSKREWLRAFFDCESYVGKNHIKIQTVNEAGMKDVMSLLSEFEITSNMYHYTPKNPNYSKVHIIRISKKNSLTRYLEQVGFNHTQKLQKLKETVKIYK
jgi:intein/homing endonuclease